MEYQEANEIYRKLVKEFLDNGIPIHWSVKHRFTVNKRLKSCWGRCIVKRVNCSWAYNNYKIEVAQHAIDYGPTCLKSVLAHELIHTVDGCFDHGDGFLSWASIVTHKLGYEVTVKKRSSVAAQVAKEVDGIEIDYNDRYKHIVVCQSCGNKVGYHNTCKTIKGIMSGRKYKCGSCKSNSLVVN